MRVVSPVPRCWHEVSMLRMHGFATPVKPRWRRWYSFCQMFWLLNSRLSGSWSSPGGSSHLILRSEVQSGHELQLLWKKIRIFFRALKINCTYLTHLSQDQKSVRRGSKEGRLEDVLVFFSSWNLSLGDLWNLLHSYSSSPMSQFFFLPLMRNFLLRCSDIPKGFLQTISSLNY